MQSGPKLRSSTVGWSLVLGVLTVPALAQAKSHKVFDYRYETIWSTTVRMLRVDRGYKITDKDKENGYLLFVYPGSGTIKRCPASIEIVAFVDEAGYRHHRMQLSIAHQAAYVEVHLLDLIERKLLEEHGRPPPARKAAPKKPKPPDKDKDKRQR